MRVFKLASGTADVYAYMFSNDYRVPICTERFLLEF